MDWVSASAWAAFPTAPVGGRGEELEATTATRSPRRADEEGAPERDEATTAPRVPAALPMRRRQRPLEPISTRGSGEWLYSDPPDREPLVRRRLRRDPTVLLGVLGLLVAALVVLLIPSLLAGGGGDPASPAEPSPSPGASRPTAATPRPSRHAPSRARPRRRRSPEPESGPTACGPATRSAGSPSAST